MRIEVSVKPRSSRRKVVHQPDGSVKVYLHESPTDGKANEALKEILAQEFNVPKSRVKIIRGQKGRRKLIEIER